MIACPLIDIADLSIEQGDRVDRGSIADLAMEKLYRDVLDSMADRARRTRSHNAMLDHVIAVLTIDIERENVVISRLNY